MTTPNINLQVAFLCLGTQTLCGHIEPPKQEANLTFYVPGLKPDEMIWKWHEIHYLVFQYYDNIEYQFIGRSLMFRYPNPLRPKSTSKTGSKSNLLRTRIETQRKRSRNGLKFNIQYYNTMTPPNINLQVVLLCLGTQTICGENEPP